MMLVSRYQLFIVSVLRGYIADHLSDQLGGMVITRAFSEEKQPLTERDESDVLHRTRGEIRHRDEVELAVRVGDSEVSFEDVDEARVDRAQSDELKSRGIVGGEELRSMPLGTRSGRRLGWLSVNIALNIVAASVIAFYQEILAQVIALAVFLPIVSDMSGCSGNQAVAVTVEGDAARSAIIAGAADLREAGSIADHDYGAESDAIRPGALTAWILRSEERGERIKR